MPMKKSVNNRESGEIMLEGMIVMVITLFMLIWILGVGFLYYQRYVVRIVTNDVAVKVAATYNSPTSDIIMGYISSGDLGSKSIYSSDELNEVNRARAESYVKYILDLANFSGVVEDVNLKLGMEKDAMNRSHIKVTTECTFNTPFGEGLELVGMSKSSKYSMTAYAEATNISDYVSAVSLADAIGSGQILAGTGFVEKVYKAINSVVKVYNKVVS